MATRCSTTSPEKSLKSFEGLQRAVRHTFERLMISCKLSSLSGFRTMLQLVTILRSRVSGKIDDASRNYSPSVVLSSELGFSKICKTYEEFSFLKFSVPSEDDRRKTKCERKESFCWAFYLSFVFWNLLLGVWPFSKTPWSHLYSCNFELSSCQIQDFSLEFPRS